MDAEPAQQGSRSHPALLDREGPVDDGWRDGGRLPVRKPRPWLARNDGDHEPAPRRRADRPVLCRRYIPSVYWLAVVLISVVGTLFSDNLVDNLGVSLWTTTGVFAVGLAASFIAWYRREHTLSIHTIVTRRREAFYWLAILFTFALGTSAGDLIAEKLAFGYLPSAAMFGAVIALITVAHHRFGLNAVFAFWSAYILTRPFGASMGDFLTASHHAGGLGLGTNGTSALFLAVILGCVGYFALAENRKDDSIDKELESVYAA